MRPFLSEDALGCSEDQALLETVKTDVTEDTKRGTGVPELPRVQVPVPVKM